MAFVLIFRRKLGKYFQLSKFVLDSISDSLLEVPHDTEILNEETRLRMLTAISMCEMKGETLDTSVIDQVLSPFVSRELHICPTFAPRNTKTTEYSPYYKTQLNKIKEKIDANIELIVVPLCDGSHFSGYIVDRKKIRIIHFDSFYPRLSGKRSPGTFLAETFLPGYKNIQITSFYRTRFQNDVHSCGAWLVLGFVGSMFGIPTAGSARANKTYNQENAFSLLMCLIENITDDEKVSKALKIFENDVKYINEHFDYEFDCQEEGNEGREEAG